MGVTAAPASALWADSVKAATPNKGGTLRLGFGHGSTTDSLDPGTFENAYMQVMSSAAYNQLVEVDNNGDLTPDLAAGEGGVRAFIQHLLQT